MATGFPYETVPLDPLKRQIRVLNFKISKETKRTDPMVCTTARISLQDEPLPAYYAVSYTWGKSPIRREINIDGHTVSIGENAYEALRVLRLHRPYLSSWWSRLKSGDGIRIWIDAICINQSHIPERNWQVAMMGDIFASAAEVLVHLGDDGGNAKETFKLIDQVYGHCENATGRFATFDKLIAQPGVGSSDLNGEKPVFAAKPSRWSMRKRRYNPLFFNSAQWGLIGRLYECHWFTRIWVIQEVTLARHSTCYFGHHHIPAWTLLIAATWLFQGGFWSQIENISWMEGVRNAVMLYSVNQEIWNLSTLIYISVVFEASEPRDKIYAVLGIAKHGQGHASIEPDYAKSVMEVYRDATRTAIQQDGDFDCLQLVTWNKPDNHERFPSWVPDYRQTRHLPTMRKSTVFESFLVEWRELTDDQQVLSLRGAAIDHIDRVGPTSWPKDLKSFGESLWDELNGPLRRDSSFSLDDLANAFACGIDATNSDIKPGGPFFDSFHHFLSCMVNPSLSGPRWWEEDSKARRSLMATGACIDLTWYITTNRRVGMCVPEGKEGDAICHIYGGKTPVVLRRDGSRWKYIGTAYMHDIDNNYPEDPEPIWFDIH